MARPQPGFARLMAAFPGIGVDREKSVDNMRGFRTGKAPFPEVFSKKKRDAMFAVIRTGGKQYKVAKNDVIFVEKLPAEAGASIEAIRAMRASGSGKRSNAGQRTG